MYLILTSSFVVLSSQPLVIFLVFRLGSVTSAPIFIKFIPVCIFKVISHISSSHMLKHFIIHTSHDVNDMNA
jgi:hypothetical protein